MNAIVPSTVVVVDTMDNSSNRAYGAYFERLYVIKDEKVVYQGGRGPEGYRISELRDWLEQYRQELEGSKPVVVQVGVRPSDCFTVFWCCHEVRFLKGFDPENQF
ncbi:hypothetical protein QTP86_008121 [Hemibagrus guttatus]|nr:hypothetical protein QTP86_008121 [Hemibagrus guttatus]